MGQAWTVALMWEEPHRGLYSEYSVRKAMTFFAHDYIFEWEDEDGRTYKTMNGYKLMETSYLGNQMVNDVVQELVSHRGMAPRIAWIGEYVDDPGDERYGIPEEYRPLAGFVNSEWERSIRHTAVQDANPRKVWILNPRLGEYVRYDSEEEGIAALALLCAVGNGMGGGDYCGANMDLVGSWAFDELTVCDEEPEGSDMTDMFKERE